MTFEELESGHLLAYLVPQSQRDSNESAVNYRTQPNPSPSLSYSEHSGHLAEFHSIAADSSYGDGTVQSWFEVVWAVITKCVSYVAQPVCLVELPVTTVLRIRNLRLSNWFTADINVFAAQ